MLEVAEYFKDHKRTTISYLVEYFKIHHTDKVRNMSDKAIYMHVRRQIRQLIKRDLLVVSGTNEKNEYIYGAVDCEKLQTAILDEIRKLERQEKILAMY